MKARSVVAGVLLAASGCTYSAVGSAEPGGPGGGNPDSGEVVVCEPQVVGTLPIGHSVRTGDNALAGGKNAHRATCSGRDGSKVSNEQAFALQSSEPFVYAFDLAGSARYPMVYLYDGTCEGKTALACSYTVDHFFSKSFAQLRGVADAGSYLAIVDDDGQGAAFQLRSYLYPLSGEKCASPAVVPLGDSVFSYDAGGYFPEEDAGTDAGARVDAGNEFAAVCGRDGFDFFHRIQLSQKSKVQLSGPYGTAISLLEGSCGGPSLECDEGQTVGFFSFRSNLRHPELDAGTYFAHLSFAPTSSGSKTDLTARVLPLRDLDAGEADTCAAAVTLAPPESVRHTTVGAANDLSPSCGRGAYAGPDRAFRLVVPALQRVVLKLDWPEHDAVLSVRPANCVAPETVCVAGDENPEDPESGSLTIDQEFAPGTYFVIVDGERSASDGGTTLPGEGKFSLDVVLP